MGMQLKPKPLQALINFVIHIHTPFIFVLLLVGYAGFVALPAFERSVKFDEKALMVGAAHASARQSVNAVRRGLQLAHAVHATHYTHDSYSLESLLAGHMRDLGLEVYTTTMDAQTIGEQNRTSAAATDGRSDRHSGHCVTLHGILRSQLGDGKEALVLVTPGAVTRHPEQSWGEGGDAPAAGAPLLLAAASAAIGHIAAAGWLGKDLIWLIPDARCGGALAATRAWVHTYQSEQATSHQAAHQPQPPFGRAGVMQQAVVVMADQVDITSLEVLVEGDDGQLPKLDMYNLLYINSYTMPGVTAQARDAGVQPWAGLRTAAGSIKEAWLREHLTHTVAMAQFVTCQAAGLPTSPHAAFKEFMVDAATARLGGKGPSGQLAPSLPPPKLEGPGALPPPLSSQLDVRAVQLAEYMEVVLRSLNNLDERFHHSYFLYLLTSPQHFVTVEVYIIPLVALIAALLLKAAAIRASISTKAARGGIGAHTSASTQTQMAKSAGKEMAEQVQEQSAAVGEAAVAPAGSSVTGASRSEATEPEVPAHDMVCLWGRAAAAAAALVLVCMMAGWLLRATACPALLGEGTSQQQRSSEGRWHLEQQVHELGFAKAVLLFVCMCIVGMSIWQQVVALMVVDTGSDGTAAQSSLHVRLTSALFPAAVHVALLSLVVLFLAAMACMNWALSYAVAALLAPLSLLPKDVRVGSVARVMQSLVLLATSPATPLAAVAYFSNLSGQGIEQIVVGLSQRVLCGSYTTTFLCFCATYLPCWIWYATLDR